MHLRNSWLGAICLSTASLVISSSVLAEPVKENIGLYGGNVMDIATMDNSGTTEVLIAVDNSQRGVYQYQAVSGSMPDHWFSTTNPPTGTSSAAVGAIPGFASQVEADASISGHVYATVSNQRTGDNGVLYFNDNFGSVSSVSPMTVGWTAVQELASSNAMLDIRTLKSGPTSVFAASQRDIYEISNGTAVGLTFSLDSMSGYADYEIVDFAIATATLAYATIRNEFGYELISIDLTTGTSSTSATASGLTLPSFAPVVQRTGACPIDSTYCAVAAELVAVDPADTTGNTIYVAGSSVNAMVFKSTDGGNTWDDGYDYQCSSDTSRTTSTCTAYGFTDGYPRGDVVRFRGTSSTSPTESRHVFIGRVVFDNDNSADGWQMVPRLRSVIRPSGASGPAITQDTNANDPALETDPNDSTKFYIATDLAIGTFTHDPSTGFPTPAAGSELANARGIEGLIVNDLDYFENAPDDKQLWIVSKSGAAFAKNYDPTDPTSVASAGVWVYPIYAGGDGAPHRAVVIDPNDKSNVIIGSTNAYLNETGDAIDPSTGSVDYSLVATPSNWTRVFEPQNFATDPSVDASTTDPLFSSNVERSYVTAFEWQTAGSCDRVYMSVANTDEGDVGGIFYSDDDGATWTADTLNGSSPRLSMPVNDLLVNDNFIWAGVGDRDGRSSEAGVRARVSYCGTSAWWKPTSSDATFTDIQANDHVAALDGVSTPSDATYDAVLYMASSNETSTRLTKASKERSSVSGCSSFACWQFTDVTPPNTYGNLSAVAVEPSDADHVWAAYSNCIVESTDGGATWAAFGGSCTDDHEEIRTLVCDDLIAGTSSGAFAYAEEANYAIMDGVFGGFLADGDTFEFPSGAEVWAGVANTNTELYPLSFPEGGEVRFRAAIPEVEGTIAPAKPWINEINYDPEGTDSGEFVEFAAPEGFDATGWRFQLINGTTGAVYAANQLVNLTKTTSGGLDLYVVNRNAGGLRNGPDGVAVINPGPDGVHATADDSCEMLVSYEGVLTNAQGLCSGVTSVEITPNQEGEAPVGQSLQLTGTGSTYADFTWVAAANTNGAVNDGQTYGATSVAGPDTTINFKFEANPSPNNSPSFSTENVVISGGLAEYSVAIPPQDANQDYNSFLMYIVENDQSVMVKDIEVVMSGDDPTEPMDADMDGVPDDEDAFPNDPAASVDADEDGMPDAWNPDATQEQIDASELMLDDDPSTPSGGPMGPPVADFTGVFGGAQAGADNTFTVPSGSESWAGFANLNTDLYPLVFEFGGSITFMGSVADGGTAEVQFRFEKKPSPDTEPSFNTEVVTIEGADPMMYQVEFEPQGTNSFESFIMYIDTRDVTVTITDVRVQPAPNPKFAVMDGVFDGFIAEGDTFEFPTGAAAWAGVANTNTALYPLSFPNGGEVRFKAGTPPEGGSTQVYFKFEANPYPNNNPSFDTSTALVSGELTDYTLEVPAQDPDQEYNSFLMYIVERDQPVMVENIEVVSFGPPDADDDGIPDSEDAFPNDPAASVDTDGDGMPDDWNEGVDDILISESTLTLDDDDDNDGYTDEEELADGTDPANADSTPFVPRSIIRLLLPILNSAL